MLCPQEKTTLEIQPSIMSRNEMEIEVENETRIRRSYVNNTNE